MQEQNLEEWKEKIDRSAEQITVPDTLTPGAVQQMLEERKNRTSAGRKEHRHYRRFAGIAAAVAVLVIAAGTYGWNKYGTDDAQPTAEQHREGGKLPHAAHMAERGKQR